MHKSDKPDLERFWMMILSGLLCAGFGGALAWLDYAAARSVEARSGWVQGQASLYEAGIRRSSANGGLNYEMTTRYVLRVDGRDYEGSEIAGGYRSSSVADVKSLVVPYAPEAAEYALQDLGALNPQRSWHVVYRPVRVRYDPRDPSQSQMVLDNPIVIRTAGRWISLGIALFLLLVAAVLWVLAWPAARGRSSGKPASTNS